MTWFRFIKSKIVSVTFQLHDRMLSSERTLPVQLLQYKRLQHKRNNVYYSSYLIVDGYNYYYSTLPM